MVIKLQVIFVGIGDGKLLKTELVEGICLKSVFLMPKFLIYHVLWHYTVSEIKVAFNDLDSVDLGCYLG